MFPNKMVVVGVFLAGLCVVASTAGKTISDDSELASILQDPELANAVTDDGGFETDLLNYLLAKQIMNRLRNHVNPQELIRKRTYWKQCAFNAVSCFGK